MKDLDVFEYENSDIVRLLKEEAEKHPEVPNTLEQFEDSDAFSEIYLFFDYDIKKQDNNNRESLEIQNAHIQEMLCYFDDETGNGKLYINYPMVESIRYFKNPLPDNDFYTYTADLFICKKFKQLANDDSFYKNLDFITFKIKKNTLEICPVTEIKKKKMLDNWNFVKELHIKKANYICTKTNALPNQKTEICQNAIFKGQLEDYVPNKKISILNGFPLFLYEYFD